MYPAMGVQQAQIIGLTIMRIIGRSRVAQIEMSAR
jgi:hypothetical protein